MAQTQAYVALGQAYVTLSLSKGLVWALRMTEWDGLSMTRPDSSLEPYEPRRHGRASPSSAPHFS